MTPFAEELQLAHRRTKYDERHIADGASVIEAEPAIVTRSATARDAPEDRGVLLQQSCYCDTGAIMQVARWLVVFALVGEHARAQGQPGPEVHVNPPIRKKHIDPEYPPSQVTSGKDVEVVITLSIDAAGKVEHAKVAVSGGQAFDDAALEAVAGWEFDPATRDGRPVHSKIRVPFHFAPPRDVGRPRATSTMPTHKRPKKRRSTRRRRPMKSR